ncbi:MAG TPA: hypothetical protein EYH45_06535 [Candidatus Caldiarchaeum subterraneum]|uniref:Proteasome assembly chaperone family protein n=1 Tax=Caldiarchaeum subterraneum TaxID=311458 RepID=A0A832ZXK5_CALS0|nr:hypothetical protein [Candidatus Caldarchaeum subterraneum]
METRIIEHNKPEEDISSAILIEASPTPGVAGIIACNYLIENFGGKKIAEIISPYFPQISLINDDGIATLPKIEIHIVTIGNQKLLILMRNFPIDSNEGSQIIAKKIYEYLDSKGIRSLFIFASGRVSDDRSIYVSSTRIDNINHLLLSGAKPAPSLDSLPVDRLTGFLMMFFAINRKDVYLMLADTPSYLPDPLAAKRMLEVFAKSLQLNVDLSKLDEEIEKHRRTVEEMERGLLGIEAERQRRTPSKEPFYIG